MLWATFDVSRFPHAVLDALTQLDGLQNLFWRRVHSATVQESLKKGNRFIVGAIAHVLRFALLWLVLHYKRSTFPTAYLARVRPAYLPDRPSANTPHPHRI